MYNNMFANYQQPTNQMYAPAPQAAMTQLDDKDIKLLQNASINQFSLDLSELDMIRAACPHRKNGQFTLEDTPSGEMRCTICGAQFDLIQATTEEVAMAVKRVNDIMQSTKALHLDMRIEILKQYMPIIELLKKLPELHQMATKTFQKYDVNVHQGAGNAYGFGMLGNIMGGGFGMMGGQPMYGQPMYGQPMYGQPPMQQQPNGMMQPMGQYPQQPGMMPQQGFNEFGYYGGDPTMGQQVGQGGVQPQMQQPIQQTEAAPAEGKLESTKVYNQ